MARDERHETRAYRSSRREGQARRTRQRVLDAATAAFLERGYAGSTMNAIASQAGVSVPTVELLFGTKGQLLKAAIDVAIAGDDQRVPVLDRSWTGAAVQADTPQEFLAIVASVIGPAQQRSAGLVLALFEASSTAAELAELATQMAAQRAITAEWIVDALTTKAALREEYSRQDAVDTVWILMDSAVFDRLVRQRRWSVPRYQRWFADSVARLLIGHTASPKPTATPRRRSI